MLVGFVHGVMNTDNMTISGETIDYGPCAFMEAFDPATVYSSIDAGGRYAYGNQPVVAEWNLARLAEALLPLLADDEEQAIALAVEALHGSARSTTPPGRPACGPSWACPTTSTRRWPGRWSTTCSACCSGTTSTTPRSTGPWARRPGATPSRRGCSSSTWRRSTRGSARWRALAPDAGAMDRVNPVYVPRNHLVEEALDAATDGRPRPARPAPGRGDPPLRRAPGLERYAEPAPQDFGSYRTFCGT